MLIYFYKVFCILFFMYLMNVDVSICFVYTVLYLHCISLNAVGLFLYLSLVVC